MPQTSRAYQFSEETCNELEKNHVVRLLLRKTTHFPSRHSIPVIDWATARASKISEALLKQIGQEGASFDNQLVSVYLMDNKTTIFICYDLFLPRCDEATRLRISDSTKRPVHYLHITGRHCYARRSKRIEAMVIQNLEESRECDLGPQPYFEDQMNPPLYINGTRQERPYEGDESTPLTSSGHKEEAGKESAVDKSQVPLHQPTSDMEEKSNPNESERKNEKVICL